MSDLALTIPDALVDAIAVRVVELLEERAALAAREPEPWISAEEAAAYIGKPKSRIYELVAQRAIRVGQDGRSKLFRKSDLDAYLLGLDDAAPSTDVNGRANARPGAPTGDPVIEPPIPLPTQRNATGARQ